MIKRILGIVSWSYLIVLVLLVLIFVAPRIVGIHPYVVTSGSMIPKYKVGSLIYVKKVPTDNIKIGDTITFYMGDTKVVATHEVYDIDLENKNFYTQGINNKDEEGNILHDALPVSFNKYIGKPIYTIPKLGSLNKAVTSKVGISIITVLTIGILIPSFLIERKEKNEK